MLCVSLISFVSPPVLSRCCCLIIGLFCLPLHCLSICLCSFSLATPLACCCYDYHALCWNALCGIDYKGEEMLKQIIRNLLGSTRAIVERLEEKSTEASGNTIDGGCPTPALKQPISSGTRKHISQSCCCNDARIEIHELHSYLIVIVVKMWVSVLSRRPG